MTKEEIKNSMMMNGGNTPEQKADFAWYNYCFEFKDGPYTAILEYKKALRREIEKESIYEDVNGSLWPKLFSKDDIFSIIDTVTPNE